MAEGKQYPRKANKREANIIVEIFGEKWLPGIEMFLDDIFDLYPFKQWYRDTNGFKYQTVGASKRSDLDFYCIGEDGNLYLKQAFMLFPIIEKNESKTEQGQEEKSLETAQE